MTYRLVSWAEMTDKGRLQDSETSQSILARYFIFPIVYPLESFIATGLVHDIASSIAARTIALQRQTEISSRTYRRHRHIHHFENEIS